MAAERQTALTSPPSTVTATATSESSRSTNNGGGGQIASPSNLDFSDPTKFINVRVDPDGKVVPLNDGESLPPPSANNTTISLEEYSPILDTLLLSITLSVLHFTLEALTVHQYADRLLWRPVIWHSLFQAFPILTLLVHVLHGHVAVIRSPSEKTRRRVKTVRQIGFVVGAVGAGCNLIRVTNEKGYMAVMKGAPAIGTVWVWCVMELGLAGAVVGVLVPGVYAWWYGYGIW